MRFFAGTSEYTIDKEQDEEKIIAKSESSHPLDTCISSDNIVEDHVALTTSRYSMRSVLAVAAYEAGKLAKEGKERRAPYNSYLDDLPDDNVWKSLRVYHKKWEDVVTPVSSGKAYEAPWRFKDFPWPLFNPPACLQNLPTEPFPYFDFMIKLRMLGDIGANEIETLVRDEIITTWGNGQLIDVALGSVYSEDHEDVIKGWDHCREILQRYIDNQPEGIAKLFDAAAELEMQKAKLGPSQSDPYNRGIRVDL